MNTYAPGSERSVPICDNCRIHHNKMLEELVNGSCMQPFIPLGAPHLTTASVGCLLLFLLPYSPDLNPIEESFSACKCSVCFMVPYLTLVIVKAHLRLHNQTIRNAADPISALTQACACITAEKAQAWFIHAGYTAQHTIQ